MSSPRHISTYSHDEQRAIVLNAIAQQRLNTGFYYDLQSDQTLRIETNPDYKAGEPLFRITFKIGFYTAIFYTDSIQKHIS